MEVINDRSAMLSNFEVLTLLKNIQDTQKGIKNTRKQQNLATISYETTKYLEKTPCKDQTEEIISAFMKALEPFKLTKAEKLQLLNQRPTSAVEIQLIIEESEERLSEEQVDELIDIICKSLPGEDPNLETDVTDEPMEEG